MLVLTSVVLHSLNAVFFDKTGTLTRGEFKGVEITPASGVSTDDASRLAASVVPTGYATDARGLTTFRKRTARRRPRLSPAFLAVSCGRQPPRNDHQRTHEERTQIAE